MGEVHPVNRVAIVMVVTNDTKPENYDIAIRMFF